MRDIEVVVVNEIMDIEDVVVAVYGSLMIQLPKNYKN
jgi:hypothetical protein